MSEAVSTSAASPPIAEPTWVPNIAPPIWPSMPISGPAIACASCGQRAAHRADDALGHRLDQPAPHLTGRLDPLGAAPGHGRGDAGRNAVASSSQWSASRTASATFRWRSVGVGVGLLGHRPAGDVAGQGPVHRAVVRRHHRLHLAHQPGQVGHPAGPPPAAPAHLRSQVKICSKGVPLKGLWASPSAARPGCSSWDQITRLRCPGSLARTRLPCDRPPPPYAWSRSARPRSRSTRCWPRSTTTPRRARRCSSAGCATTTAAGA